jgi:hypothetical protein
MLEAPSISPQLYQQVQATLLRCGAFRSDSDLPPLFIDSRISAWRYDLPSANSTTRRVQAVVDYLLPLSNPNGENALVLFLRVLSDQKSHGDACYGQLGALADALARELKPSTVTAPDSGAPGENSFRARKRQLVQQRLDALVEEYEAANNQLMQALAEIDRVRLRRQIATLDKQIQETEAELAVL